MGRKIKYLFLSIIFALCLLTTPITNDTIATYKVQAATIGINKKKADLWVGETLKLKIKGTNEKVKWSSNNKKIATVNKNGVVTGIGKGTVTIKATLNKKTYTCKITVLQHVGVSETSVVCEGIKRILIEDYSKSDSFGGEVEIQDASIADFYIGEWFDTDKVYLYIKPKNPGTTEIHITTNYSKEVHKIKVTVPKPTKLTSEEIYEKAANATVELTAYAADYSYTSLGTGFFIGDGLLVTNYHVVDGCDYVTFEYDGFTYELYVAQGYDVARDLIVFNVEGENDSLPMESGVKTGEPIYTYGSSKGLTGTFSDGIVSTANRKFDGVNYIQITAPISEGNSGGPLLNTYGQVIGVNTMYILDGQNLNFAVDIDELANLDYSESVSLEYINVNENNGASIHYEDEATSGSYETADHFYYNFFMYGELIDKDDVDYYRITVLEGQSILLGHPDDSYSSILTLCDSQGNVVDSAYNEVSDTTRILGYDNLPEGDYFIKVQRQDITGLYEYLFLYKLTF